MKKIAWPPSRCLRSGDLGATFDRGDIARLSRNGHELVRLLHVAIRDPSWNTIPATPVSVHLVEGPARFIANVRARTTGARLDLDWHLDVMGFPDGTLHADFRARALRDCAFARIGLCLHFDAEHFKHASYEADSGTASWTGRFPEQIHPQYLVDGIHQPCIAAFSSMRITLAPDTGLDIRLEGDQFEIEDQRNWTDATFKAYTTPLASGELHHLANGGVIRQTLQVRLRAPAQAPVMRQDPIRAMALAPLRQRMPELGAALAPGAGPSPPPSIDFAHWRLELRSEADVQTVCERIRGFPPGKGIELVLHPDAVPDHLLRTLLAPAVRTGTLSRLILLGETENLPSPAQVLAIKAMTQSMAEDLSVGAGAADAYADLARDRRDFSGTDFIAFPISPQCHVFDTPSIFETLRVQEQVVRDATRRTANGRVIISALTFGSQAPSGQAADPHRHRDPRVEQAGAAWLGASFGRIALGGAASVTLAPDLWLAKEHPTALGRLLQILTGLGEASMRPFDIDDPRRIFVFGATLGQETIVFLTNLTARWQTACLSGLSEGTLTDVDAPHAAHDGMTPLSTGPAAGSMIELPPFRIRILRHQPVSNLLHSKNMDV